MRKERRKLVEEEASKEKADERAWERRRMLANFSNKWD